MTLDTGKPIVLPSQALKFPRPLRITQARTLDRFAYLPEAGLFHEMGTGKTTEAIALLRAKYNVAKAVTPTLVISPVATLKNWLDEFKLNAPTGVVSKCEVLHGSEVKRIDLLLKEDKGIWITNPEFLDMTTALKVLAKKNVTNIVIDEADCFKSHKGKRFDNLIRIVDRTSFRVLMTGTPILNSYLDLWALYRLLDKGATFGTNFFLFRKKYFKDENEGLQLKLKSKQFREDNPTLKYYPSWVPKNAGIGDELSKLMEKKCSRLKKEDCLDLPPLVQMTEYVEMGREQEKAYRAMETELVAEVSSGFCTATNALSKLTRMLQILSGFMPTENGVHHFKENPRLDRLEEHLATVCQANKAIVWACFSENYAVIRERLEKLGIKYVEITGESSDHFEAQARFQNDPECRVVLANPQAGGVGINLTQSCYAFYYNRNYSLRYRLQSLARNHRGGSEIHDKITAVDLAVQGTLDEDVLNALNRKEEFAENVLERIRKRFADKIAAC